MQSSGANRILLGLLASAATLLAAPADDMPHPRSPEQKLNIDLGPHYCAHCLEKGDIAQDEERGEIEFMLTPASEMASKLGIKKGKYVAIETPNFKIFSTLKGTKVRSRDAKYAAADMQRLKEILPKFKPGNGGSYLKPHERAHLYHVRLERMYAHFAALMANDQRHLGMGARFEIYLFEKKEEYEAFAKKVLVMSPNGAYALQHHERGDGNFQLMVTCQKLLRGGDRELNNMVAHHTAHLLVNGHKNYYTNTWAWLEEGLAHYYGRQECEKHNHFCIGSRMNIPSTLARGNWSKRLHHEVYRGKEPTLGHWCEKLQPNELTPEQGAVAWSIVDWLMETDPVRLARLVDEASDYERKPTTAQATQDVFGVSPDVLHERWRKYVLKKQ